MVKKVLLFVKRLLHVDEECQVITPDMVEKLFTALKTRPEPSGEVPELVT
jgi:hypothetical protein